MTHWQSQAEVNLKINGEIQLEAQSLITMPYKYLIY